MNAADMYIYICMSAEFMHRLCGRQNSATGTRSLVVKASALEKPGTLVRVLASVRFFHLFRCVLSSVLPLRSVGRFNFDKGLHILVTTLIQGDIIIRTAMLYIYTHR